MHYMPTIVAQCTPQGSGALALIRISGNNALTIADHISQLSSQKKLSQHATHTIHYGSVIDHQNKILDTVLFLLMRGPKTFTGLDTVEITCHNNAFIIESIIAAAIQAGAQPAGPGEFTQQAVLNNKIDLIQAEAINDLIHAHNQEALKRSMAQLEGTLSHTITTLEQQLVHALALSEASFEFLDEEELEFIDQIRTIVEQAHMTIQTLHGSTQQQKIIKEGIRIVLIGSVNAGKSSLLNCLVGAQRAIVTPQAGTTRDTIEAGIYQEGLYWTFIDTAGLRSTHDSIEKEGIARSYQEAQKADIILLVFDQNKEHTPSEKHLYTDLHNAYVSKTVIIANKEDLPPATSLPFGTHDLGTHTNDRGGAHRIKTLIKEKIRQLFASHYSPFLLTQRQIKLLNHLSEQLIPILQLCTEKPSYELISHHLRVALEDIGELTGKSVSEKAMNAIFRTFCVGK